MFFTTNQWIFSTLIILLLSTVHPACTQTDLSAEQELSSSTTSLPSTITVQLPDLEPGAKPLEMTLIKAGAFTMGAALDERARHEWEWLPHSVTITRDYYLGKYEVTQAQWQAVMGSNPAREHGIGADYPVYYVTWNDCQQFIDKLNQSGQGKFRLPTEAEWEYACRAGTTMRFSHGDVLECGDVCEACPEHDKYMWWCGNNNPQGAKEVGLKLPNPWGLYDMHGNVYEWCQDWWEEPYEREAVTDPQGPAAGTHRVLRGGGWSFDALGCRSAFRYGYSPDNPRSYSGFGFRLLREVSAM
ncbi:MAG: formylglycine-generating enzyme family protein [bacterium]|jgi:formylglycine-generating enzyme required for sulfatase activity